MQSEPDRIPTPDGNRPRTRFRDPRPRGPQYAWRQLSDSQRQELLDWRIRHHRPWHSPPHRPNCGHRLFLISAACFEHRHHIGYSLARMDQYSAALLGLFRIHSSSVLAWCVLPNHYHALTEAPDITRLLHELGRFHGRTSHAWNGEEGTRGRQVFHRATERFMRSDRHWRATLNYIHHNPVHHGYVNRWTDWPWSSAAEYLAQVGRDEAWRSWIDYRIRDYGKGWDDRAL